MKKTLLLITLLFTACCTFAATVSFHEDIFSGTITYNEKAQPGEAVWARMNMKIDKKKEEFFRTSCHSSALQRR